MTADQTEKEAESVDFQLELARKRFLYKATEVADVDRESLKTEILNDVTKNDLSHLYKFVCNEFGWEVDEALYSRMTEANDKHLEELSAKIKDAEENLGESEVREAMLARANFLAKIGDKDGAMEAFKATEEKTVAMGLRMDLVFSILRIQVFHGEWHGVKASIDKAKRLFEEGGDWERKNRLKVYESLYLMATRNFKQAAELFLDSLATFTTYELFTYNTFIFYTVLTSMISLDRVSLKKKVVDAPEVLTVIDQIPNLAEFLNSLYNCKYKELFQAFARIADQVQADMYLNPHFNYYIREIRVLAYTQFLESYKSVTLQSMAESFGVSVGFLDGELSNYIVAGRLNAKIDTVEGVVATNRPDAKNSLYQQAIKQGDLLLNNIQKLSKVIDME
uniref:26S proteasome regulatory subunit RPN7 n=1 Tax=Tetraselmis sp. GSL018 TaxID=582737 RepID=A0A061SAG0_9CHLO|mmetsp:Transcript_2424/g.5738  ORF Transcript_2424/g.5738 Transcript_2424/m.5738 type:complete len:393 (+) Transcript_2424:143-1321(+)